MWTWRVENNQLQFRDDQGRSCSVLGYAEPPQVNVQGDEAAVQESDGRWAIYDLTSGILKERRF